MRAREKRGKRGARSCTHGALGPLTEGAGGSGLGTALQEAPLGGSLGRLVMERGQEGLCRGGELLWTGEAEQAPRQEPGLATG